MARRRRQARRRGQPQLASPASIAPFNGGVNSQQTYRTMASNECIYAYNLVPHELGLRTRPGYSEWVRNLTSPKKVIPYHGQNPTGSGDKLFVGGNDGIYDITSSGTGTPSRVVAFAGTNTSAGDGVFTHFTNDDGDDFILYADAVYGLYIYTASTNTWAAASGITGIPSVANVRFVMHHKQRIWLIAENSPDAWYLPISSISGAATQFFFGSNFREGGDLAGLFTWTRDGGSGVDDYLVAISRGGDTLSYAGSDPAESDWELRGHWEIGALPNTRKFAHKYGGDLIILSSYGCITASELFRGVEFSDTSASITGKITRVIRSRMAAEIGSSNWIVKYVPSEGSIMISSPRREGDTDEYTQYMFNMNVKGWGYWRGMPILDVEMWREKLYFTSHDGRVWQAADAQDGVLLDDADLSEANPVDFSILSSYQDFNLPALNKKVEMMRPTYLGPQAVGSRVKALYDYQLDEIGVTGAPSETGSDVWDTGNWDSAVWGSTVNKQTGHKGVTGGPGKMMAVAIRGSAIRRTTLAEIEIILQAGGYL
jgi:hypothetical protein